MALRPIITVLLLLVFALPLASAGRSMALQNAYDSGFGLKAAKGGDGPRAARPGNLRTRTLHASLRAFGLRGERVRPRPTGRDLLFQGIGGFGGMFLGAGIGVVIGGIIGGVAEGPVHPDGRWWGWEPLGDDRGMQYGAIAGTLLGSGFGVWWLGNDDFYEGNLWWTLLGGVVGSGLSIGMTAATFGILAPTVLVMPVGGAMLAYNLTRWPVERVQDDKDSAYNRSPAGLLPGSLAEHHVGQRAGGSGPVYQFQILNLRF